VKLPGWWPVAAVALGLLAWTLVRRHWQHDGALREQIHAREVTIAALAKQHRTDTLRLVTTRHTTDSVLRTDTVFTPATVKQIVTSERLACDAVLGTCEAEKAALRDLVALERKRARGFRFLGIPLGCTAGLAGTPAGVNIGGSCGVRIK
jgi:hypothetical protein